MSSQAFQSWSPRTRPLIYDSLQQDVGCQVAQGVELFTVKPFVLICIHEHNADPEAVVNRSDLVSYATGPLNTGGALPWPTRWAAWVSAAGIRVAKLPVIVPPSSGIGSVSGLYGSTKPSKLSLSFTAMGQMAIAIQKNAQSVEVKWFNDAVGASMSTASFLGLSPVLFQSGILSPGDDDGESDLVVYYLRKEVPRTIFARFLRDNFSTECIAAENLQANVSQLIGVEAVDRKQVLYARDIFGRDVTLSTDTYKTVIDGDAANLTLSILNGGYTASAVTVALPVESSTLTVSIVNGSYHDPVQEPSPPLSVEKATLTLSIQSGDYQ